MMRISRRQFTTAAALLISVNSLGCSTFQNKSANSDKSFFERLPFVGKKSDDQPDPYPNPVKMAATWTPDTLVQTGRTPTRGFGGRVFFYDEKSRAVPVEGTLIIHGFDDSEDPGSKNAKRFEFTPEQFTRHFSKTDLGASYSVWIPWDAIGGEQRRISLVTSFKTVDGKLIQGIPATAQLPGTTAKQTPEDEFAKLSPQYRQMREAVDATAPKSGLSTTTIARRRLPSQRAGSPGLNVPGMNTPGSAEMIASGGSTPALDIQMLKNPTSPSVMPASATIPINR